MLQQLLKWLQWIEKFTLKVWYVPMVAILAALDIFILVLPIDTLLISASAFRPKSWPWVAALVTLGSSLGVALMGLTLRYIAHDWFFNFFSNHLGPETWAKSEHYLSLYGGWTFFIAAIGPFPLAPMAIVGASGKALSITTMFAFTYFGRIFKFSFFSWAATHSPGLLKKIFGKRKEFVPHSAESVDRKI